MGDAGWRMAALGCALLAWQSAPQAARALGSCGSGGVQGEREMVAFEGSLYYVTTPAGYDEGRQWPLILGLHGDEGDPARSVNWNWRSVVDDRFIFVAPKATNEGGSWYMASEQNAQWMDALLESLLSQYNVDLDRVYIWGLSGGAEFISGYALARQERFAAAQWNMGGNAWGWRRAGMESPDTCKLPARFVVSTTDFLRDGALALYDGLTEAGHETLWLDADCEGHCWDEVESGVGAREWLLARTLCGTTRPAGCEGEAAATPEPMEPAGAAGAGAPPPEQPAEPQPDPEPAPAPMPEGAAPAAPAPVASGPAAPTPGTAPVAPGAPAPQPPPVTPVVVDTTMADGGGGCSVATTGRAYRGGGWLLLGAGAWLGLGARRRRRRRR